MYTTLRAAVNSNDDIHLLKELNDSKQTAGSDEEEEEEEHEEKEENKKGAKRKVYICFFIRLL